MSDAAMIPTTGNLQLDQRIADKFGAGSDRAADHTSRYIADFKSLELTTNGLGEYLFLIKMTDHARLLPIVHAAVKSVLQLGHPDSPRLYSYITSKLGSLCDATTLQDPDSRANLDDFRVAFMTHFKASIDTPSAAYLTACGHAIPFDTCELRNLLYIAVAFLHKEHSSQLVTPYDTDPAQSPFVESGYPACLIGFTPPADTPEELDVSEEDARSALARFSNMNNDEGAAVPNKRSRPGGPATATQSQADPARQHSQPMTGTSEHHASFDEDEGAAGDDHMDTEEADDGGGWTQKTYRSSSVSFSQSQAPPSQGQVKAGIAKPRLKTQEGFSDELQALATQENLSMHPSHFISVSTCHGNAVAYASATAGEYPDDKKALVILADIPPLVSLTTVLTQTQFDYPNASFHWQSASGDKAQQRLTVRLYGLPDDLSPTRLAMWWRSMFGDHSFIQSRQIPLGTDEGKAAPCWEVQFWRGNGQVFSYTDVSERPVSFPPLNGTVRFYPFFTYAWQIACPWRSILLRLKGLPPSSDPLVFKDNNTALVKEAIEALDIDSDRPPLQSQFSAFDHHAGAMTVALPTRHQANALTARGISVGGIPVSIKHVPPMISETIARERHTIKVLLPLDEHNIPIPVLQTLVTGSLQALTTSTGENLVVVSIVAISAESWTDVGLFKVSLRKPSMVAAALEGSVHHELRFFHYGELQVMRMAVNQWERRPTNGGRSRSRGPPDRGRATSRGRSKGRAGNSKSRTPATAPRATASPSQPSFNQSLGLIVGLNQGNAQRVVDVLVHSRGTAAVAAMVAASPGPQAPTPSVLRALAISAKQHAGNPPAAQPRPQPVPAPAAAPPNKAAPRAQNPPPAQNPSGKPAATAAAGRGRGRQGRHSSTTPAPNVQPLTPVTAQTVPTQWPSQPAAFVMDDDMPQASDARMRPAPTPAPAPTRAPALSSSNQSAPEMTMSQLSHLLLQLSNNVSVISDKMGIQLPRAPPDDSSDPQSKNA